MIIGDTAFDVVEDSIVSTVSAVGFPNLNDGDAYETAVFYADRYKTHLVRYPNFDDAIKGHEAIVRGLQEGTFEPNGKHWDNV